MCIGLHVQCPNVILVRFEWNLNFLDIFSKNWTWEWSSMMNRQGSVKEEAVFWNGLTIVTRNWIDPPKFKQTTTLQVRFQLGSSTLRPKIRLIQLPPYEKVNFTPGERFRPLYPGKETPYSWYRRVGGPQGRSGRVRKISPPPGFDPRTVQLVASRCPGLNVRHTGYFYLQSKKNAKLSPVFWRQLHKNTCPHTCKQRVLGDRLWGKERTSTQHPLPRGNLLHFLLHEGNVS
jgi:hypothetical protein